MRRNGGLWKKFWKISALVYLLYKATVGPTLRTYTSKMSERMRVTKGFNVSGVPSWESDLMCRHCSWVRPCV